MQSQLLLAWLGSSHSPPSLSPGWRYCVDDRHPYRSPSFTHPRKAQESTHEWNSNLKTVYLYIRWMYFNSWLSKRSFQDLSCSLHSCMIQFVSQTESIWTLWNTKVLFVKFETEVLLTYIQIYTKIPRYQVAACRHLLWRHYSGFANTFNFSSKAHSTDRDRWAWKSSGKLYVQPCKFPHLYHNEPHKVTLLAAFASPHTGVLLPTKRELNITPKTTQHKCIFF